MFVSMLPNATALLVSEDKLTRTHTVKKYLTQAVISNNTTFVCSFLASYKQIATDAYQCLWI